MSVWQAHDDLNIRTERPLTGHDMVSAYLENNDIATCESVGAGMGGIFLRDNHEKYGITSATINIDSQACLKALAASQINSQTVLNTVLRLNEAARFLPGGLSLRWVKAHLDGAQFRGNNSADEAAKIGAKALNDEALLDPREVPNRRLSALKFDIMQLLQNEWNKRWTINRHQVASSSIKGYQAASSGFN